MLRRTGPSCVDLHQSLRIPWLTMSLREREKEEAGWVRVRVESRRLSMVIWMVEEEEEEEEEVWVVSVLTSWPVSR